MSFVIDGTFLKNTGSILVTNPLSLRHTYQRFYPVQPLKVGSQCGQRPCLASDIVQNEQVGKPEQLGFYHVYTKNTPSIFGLVVEEICV